VPKLAKCFSFTKYFVLQTVLIFRQNVSIIIHHDFLIFFVNQDERNLPSLNDVPERFPPLATQPDILFSVPNYCILEFAKPNQFKNHKNIFGELEKKNWKQVENTAWFPH